MLNACPTIVDLDVYQPRNPKASAYYRCVEEHFEQLETVWDERYQSRKRLRIYFMMDRKLLAKLSQCAWKALNLYLTQAVPYDDAKAGAVVAVESFGDFQNFHPHLHVLCTDGCFYNDAAFMVCPPPDTGALETLFRHEVFKMLKAEGKINDVIIENMMNWRHSGFNVYCGKAIWPPNEDGLENLARYTCPPLEDHPSFLFSKADELYSGQ